VTQPLRVIGISLIDDSQIELSCSVAEEPGAYDVRNDIKQITDDYVVWERTWSTLPFFI